MITVMVAISAPVSSEDMDRWTSWEGVLNGSEQAERTRRPRYRRALEPVDEFVYFGYRQRS